MNLPILGTSYKWNYIIFVLLYLARFIYHVFKVHPCCGMCQNFVPFCSWIMFHCMDIPHFIYLFIHWASLREQMVEDLSAMEETQVQSWGPWRRKWQSIPVFLPQECRGQKSLASYSPGDGRVRHYRVTHTLTLSLSSSPGRRLGCFCLLALVTQAAVGVQEWAWVSALRSFGWVYPEVGLVDHTAVLCLTFEELPNCLPWWQWHFTFPPAMHQSSSVSTSSPTPIISHPNKCVHFFLSGLLSIFLVIFIESADDSIQHGWSKSQKDANFCLDKKLKNKIFHPDSK